MMTAWSLSLHLFFSSSTLPISCCVEFVQTTVHVDALCRVAVAVQSLCRQQCCRCITSSGSCSCAVTWIRNNVFCYYCKLLQIQFLEKVELLAGAHYVRGCERAQFAHEHSCACGPMIALSCVHNSVRKNYKDIKNTDTKLYYYASHFQLELMIIKRESSCSSLLKINDYSFKQKCNFNQRIKSFS